jgi:hypothetical protein
MAPKKALLTPMWSPKWGPTLFNDVEIDGTSQEPSMFNSLLTVGNQKCTVVQTSTFAGHIHSLSLSPTSPGIAIAYGNEIALAVVISNPYRLKDDREYLPKPPAYHLGANKPGGPVAKSLQFTRKKNHLVVTYAAHGIVYVPSVYPRIALNYDSSIWDPHALTVAGEIVPRTFPMYAL